MKLFNFKNKKNQPDNESNETFKRERTKLSDCESNMPCINSEIFERGSNGYLNYGLYEVTGKSTDGKPIKFKINSINETSAREHVISGGLSEEFSVIPIEFKTPTAQQLEYALDLGITIPVDCCHEDISCLINRVNEDDEKSPPVPLAVYADRKGAQFSAWVGEKAFMNMLFLKLEQRDRLAFFAYCVYCYLYSKSVANLDDSDDAELFYNFADSFSADVMLNSSLNRMEGASLIEFGTYEGKTGTAAYILAAKYFLEHNSK
jgi:hypothetical protein